MDNLVIAIKHIIITEDKLKCGKYLQIFTNSITKLFAPPGLEPGRSCVVVENSITLAIRALYNLCRVGWVGSVTGKNLRLGPNYALTVAGAGQHIKNELEVSMRVNHQDFRTGWRRCGLCIKSGRQ